MPVSTKELQDGLMEAMGRITSFWGFGKVMGQLYALLYLSPDPMTLDVMSESLAISKGNASINIRALERWNMVRKIWMKGDRKDYYEAEIDFWKIVKGVLKEREKKEFDLALGSVSSLLRSADEGRKQSGDAGTAFAVERLRKLEDFIQTMDRLVGTLLTLEDLKRNFLGTGKKR